MTNTKERPLLGSLFCILAATLYLLYTKTYMQELTPFVNSLNHYLSLCAVIATIVLTLYALCLIILSTTRKTTTLTDCVSKYILPFGFLVSLGGMLMSLYYSEFLHITACDLCWYQRIFMYSQVFIFGYAWYKKDKQILPYSLLLSCVGLAIAIYHHLLQLGFSVYKPCSTAPFAVDCSKPTFIEFGFVTFPYMAVVLFTTLILLVVTNKYFAKR